MEIRFFGPPEVMAGQDGDRERRLEGLLALIPTFDRSSSRVSASFSDWLVEYLSSLGISIWTTVSTQAEIRPRQSR